jgi:hypothetical protein
MARISDATPKLTLDGDELLLAEDAASDVNFPIETLSDFVKDNLTPAETLAKVIASNPSLNGLNSNFLQGLTAAYFENASNLRSGTVPDARLPFGEFNTSWSSGGATHVNAGIFKAYWKIPQFIANGPKIMIQFGWSGFVGGANNIDVTFLQPFSGGWSNENKPWVGVFPECRRDGWSGTTSRPDPRENIEIDVRLWYTSLTSFKASTKRDYGGQSDLVRANWIAIGYYS